MIQVVFWKWQAPYQYRSKFTAEHVNIAKAMVRRNCTLPLEFVCITDDATGLDPDIRAIPLWENPAKEYGDSGRPNCLFRVKAFAEEMRRVIGEKFIWFDLDMVITGNIDHIVGAPDDFAMWGDTSKTFQYNGSLCLMRAGVYDKVATDFKGIDDLKAARAAGFIGSDQAWISYKIGTKQRMFGQGDGVYSFKNHYRDKCIRALIPGTKIVFFHGQHDPWHNDIQAKYAWVKEHYRA